MDIGHIGGSRVKGRLRYRDHSYPHCSLPVIAEALKDGSKDRCLELSTDQGYGATCVPASVDE